MQVETAIKQALEEKESCVWIQGPLHVSWTGLNRSQIYETDKGRFFVKINDSRYAGMFEGEVRSLEAIRETHTLRVPRPIAHGSLDGEVYLLLEYIPLVPHTTKSEILLGQQLARLHLIKQPHPFGFPIDNAIGTTPQINTPSNNWVEFFIEKRLRFQLNLIEKKYEDHEILRLGEHFLTQLPALFKGVDPYPSLLHGDLWHGNTAATVEGEPIVYDPAAYYGHHEAEFGILLMFGGFSPAFFEAYRELIPEAPGFSQRQRAYRLYHTLNHYNLFGSGYRSACLALLK